MEKTAAKELNVYLYAPYRHKSMTNRSSSVVGQQKNMLGYHKRDIQYPAFPFRELREVQISTPIKQT